MAEIMVRYFHFFGIIVLSSALTCECLLITKEIDKPTLKKLLFIDAIYSIGAITVITAGMMLWFVVGKPGTFYTNNYLFISKISLFAVVGILSAFPTYFFLRNRKFTEPTLAIPNYLLTIIRIEMAMVLGLPMLAVLMAAGIGQL